MLRVPLIILSIFSLRIFLMFVIQLNSSLELVLYQDGNVGNGGGNAGNRGGNTGNQGRNAGNQSDSL